MPRDFGDTTLGAPPASRVVSHVHPSADSRLSAVVLPVSDQVGHHGCAKHDNDAGGDER